MNLSGTLTQLLYRSVMWRSQPAGKQLGSGEYMTVSGFIYLARDRTLPSNVILILIYFPLKIVPISTVSGYMYEYFIKL